MSKSTSEHLATISRAISSHDREAKASLRTVESRVQQLQVDLENARREQAMPGILQHIPTRFQTAFFSLIVVSHAQARRSEEASANGKPESRMPAHDTDAYRELRKIQRYLLRQADWAERVVSAVVDKECASEKCHGVVKEGVPHSMGIYCPDCAKKRRDRREERLEREARTAA